MGWEGWYIPTCRFILFEIIYFIYRDLQYKPQAPKHLHYVQVLYVQYLWLMHVELENLTLYLKLWALVYRFSFSSCMVWFTIHEELKHNTTTRRAISSLQTGVGLVFGRGGNFRAQKRWITNSCWFRNDLHPGRMLSVPVEPISLPWCGALEWDHLGFRACRLPVDAQHKCGGSRRQHICISSYHLPRLYIPEGTKSPWWPLSLGFKDMTSSLCCHPMALWSQHREPHRPNSVLTAPGYSSSRSFHASHWGECFSWWDW